MNVLRNQAELIIVNKQRLRDRKAKKCPLSYLIIGKRGQLWINTKIRTDMYTILIIWTIIILSTFLQNNIEIFFFFFLKKKSLKPSKVKIKNKRMINYYTKKSAIQHLNINNNNSIFGCKSRSFLQCLNQDEGKKNTKTFLS